MISIYLCDDHDEQLHLFQKILEHYIDKTKIEAKIVSVRNNPEDTIADSKREKAEKVLFFVDIQLDGFEMDGFELVNRLKKINKNFYYVFLTSRSDLAYRVFEEEMDIIDYVVKDTAEYLSSELSEKTRLRLNRIFKVIQEKQNKQKQKIIYLDRSGNNRVLESEIVCIETDTAHRKIMVYAKDRVIISGMPLKELEAQLSKEFLTVNKGCIIAVHQMETLDKKNRMVSMKNGKQYEISFRKIKEVTEAYWKMKEGE